VTAPEPAGLARLLRHVERVLGQPDQPWPPTGDRVGSGRRRAAGIYGTVVTAAVIDTAGDHVSTEKLVIAVVVTLLVYWVAEQYAEVLGEHTIAGHPPTWPEVKTGLVDAFPMVGASYLPLLALVVTRVAGASAPVAANVGLGVALVLLIYHGWAAARVANLRGRSLLVATLIGAGLGLVMILLKDVVLLHLH
jgi:hypothetical protein